VSGEPVVLAAGSAPLVTAVGHASRAVGVRAVVIGCLAVIRRLQRAHRATGDVDTQPTDTTRCRSSPASLAPPCGKDITIDGVTVHVIDT
jgi:hypothetical protein